ncbi:MAG TPA: class I SAM-dependent methyltransferase [Verrucomicrobiae bacterium]|nr:class I SAM-dependent methyltransferase [Verrucomicrobiae bacterium]
MSVSYSSRFQHPDAVKEYESKEYAGNSYSTSIWQLQQPTLERILKNFQQERKEPVQLLDFACGTGRVLACLEKLADTAEGIDISEKMVAVAKTKCVKARFQVGDILSDTALLQKKYDVISCFRFLLNVEPEMRGRILRRLREVLREPDGLLLVNVHGNSRSLRHPAVVWRRRRIKESDALLNEMSPAETKKLLQESGFQVVRQFGFGIVPPTVYRTPLRKAAVAADKLLAGENWLNNWSIDMLFVCRPAAKHDKPTMN